MIQALKAYALANYEAGGHWVYETYDTADYEVIVATTNRQIDDKIITIAQNCGVKFFRGSANDVLDRFFKAAMKFDGKIIVRNMTNFSIIKEIF